MFENVKMALSSLYTHKMRSILTMIGIVIGVSSVIAVVAIGQGGEAMLKAQFSGEENIREIYYEPSEEEIESNPEALSKSTFSEEDIRTIENISEVQRVIKSSTKNSHLRYYEAETNGNIRGISEGYIEVNQLKIAFGRNFINEDFFGGNRSVIVSESFRERLFNGNEMLGEVLYIGSQPVKIVGILEKGNSLFGMHQDIIYLPLKTWQNIFASSEISEVSIQAETPEALQTAGDKAVETLNRVHDKEGAYQIFNMEEIGGLIEDVTNIMTIVIGSIAGVSLIVGGIGVMNIMLVSVTERTREIGIRMSLGATRREILAQFLVESIILTLFGGLFGMLIGVGGAMLVSYFAGWPSLISLPVIVGGIVFSMCIGVIFGILPANKAAKMDPVKALGHE
ncbi:macrolide ABC transporter permease [Oceanobacillus picturae]|uniref:Macrolide ABC transporter permease n=2 Tax=Oceanobacillus picturae TaxID=171693 RepID=A0A0U9HBJ6_9BACI|nr:macrolide ABC transporter permease [Oceanobacillus picturae]